MDSVCEQLAFIERVPESLLSPSDCPALRVRTVCIVELSSKPMPALTPPCTHRRLGSKGLQLALRKLREGPVPAAVFLLPSAGTPLCGPSRGQLFTADSEIRVLALELENLLGRIVSVEL